MQNKGCTVLPNETFSNPFILSCENRHLRRNSPHGDKRLYIHTFQILQGPFPFQLFLEGQTTVWRRTHAAAPTTLSHQPTRAAGRQAITPLTGATHTACGLESRRVDGGAGGGGGGSPVDSFEGKA